jgi:hypothetical protein
VTPSRPPRLALRAEFAGRRRKREEAGTRSPLPGYAGQGETDCPREKALGPLSVGPGFDRGCDGPQTSLVHHFQTN